MNHSTQLPKNFEKALNELARAREKAAKQKYLLDLGESLVMHLCSFVLGEYKATDETFIDLEKSFIKNSKNVSFGIYLGWLRESSKFLYKQQKPSKIHVQLHGSNEFNEVSFFVKLFEKTKQHIDNEDTGALDQIPGVVKNQNLGKTSFLQFFDAFIQLRNRVAHPHKEVKGKIISWPFGEDYFDLINPCLEDALMRVIRELDHVWEFKSFIVDDNDGKLLTLIDDEFEQVQIPSHTRIEEGMKVIRNVNDQVLISDWKLLLAAGEEAISKIKEEEDTLRNKASIENLKESIKSALDDFQISLDEMNFFESLGKTKLGLSKTEIKNLILEVAKELEIENPFPDVDKRFIEVLDNAIINKTFNEFLLKLSGQQYGVDSEKFDALFQERSFALNVDPNEVLKHKVIQFTQAELQDFQGLMKAQQWLNSIGLFNTLNKESQYKITGDSYAFGTKEYNHRTAFKAVERFVQSRISNLTMDNNAMWGTNQNNWQIGAMTGYAWCSVFPKDSALGKVLAMHLSLYSDGSAATGFLPDWKDFDKISNLGLLRSIFRSHLIEFIENYSSNLSQYPKLKLWDHLTANSFYSFLESYQQFPSFYKYLYNFEQIQFYLTGIEIANNPLELSDSFDIAFNLFNDLFDGVNRDYQNTLNQVFNIEEKETVILAKLDECVSVFQNYQLIEIDKKGSANQGFIGLELTQKIKSYPVTFQVQFTQDHLKNELTFQLIVKCAGYLESEYHEKLENVLRLMNETHHFKGESIYMRSLLALIIPIENVDEFDSKTTVNEFLQLLTNTCAENYVEFLGAKVSNPSFDNYCLDSTAFLDELKETAATYFTNQVYEERNPMKGYRFLDYISSNKKVGHWLGWGCTYSNEKTQAGIIFHLSDTLKGAHIKEEMEKLSLENSHWKLVELDQSSEGKTSWIFNDLSPEKMTSSTDWNRNYSAKFAAIDSPKNYWCAKKQDDKQWIQFEFDQPMEVSKIKIQGAPHGKFFIKRFVLAYSVDGKNWNELTFNTELKSGMDTSIIPIENQLNAKFIRINVIEFEGYPGLRIDFLASEIIARKLELQALSDVNNSEDLKGLYSQLTERFNDIKTMNGLGF